MILEENIVRDPITGTDQVRDINKIKSFLDCRYLSACEACWRIYHYDIQYRSVGVERLNFHLPDEHSITFKDSENIDNVLNRFDVHTTMFTEWMKTNAIHEDVR